jgi:histidinol-phosphatase (PHP family)
LLTDYHLHLRTDERENTPERFFTPANVERYREAAEERGITELGVAEHIYRFTAALEIWQHPFWREFTHDDLDDYCGFVREETDLRLGIEMDFVVGSVHFLRDHSLDTEDYSVWGAGESAEKIWRRYFETVAESARSGLYDIIAHPDLVKVWGRAAPRPDTDLRRYYEPTVEAFLDAGVAVELSTAGWRKPVAEQYPSVPFLEMLVDAGCPLALSSDAHQPDQVGFEYERAVELLESLGVRELAVFEGRERRLEPIG